MKILIATILFLSSVGCVTLPHSKTSQERANDRLERTLVLPLGSGHRGHNE